jgi:hypothetical protein
MASRLAAILEGLRGALRHEPIPPPSPAEPQGKPGPGLLQLVFARERLAEDPVPPEAGPGRTAGIFAVERLAEDPVPAAATPSRWLAWMVGPEHLDD